jgi:8-oxo-dGTP pyrophosphatase MutT (NUDIX family)
LDLENKKILLIHNKALQKWLVPGGHYEKEDLTMINNAKRELEEETGIKNFYLHPWHKKNKIIPINIDTHFIPENKKKQEKEHYHHDFNYIFILEK